MAHRSALYDLHRALGATFQEEDGWELPGRYQDPTQEHRAIRESVGIVDLPFRTVYRVTGTERTRFLNGMLTNDINKLEEGHGCYACLLTPQGKIVADMEVYASSFCMRVQAYDREGKQLDFSVKNFFARVVQHECDHLHGILFLDRMQKLDTLTYLTEHQRYWATQEG